MVALVLAPKATSYIVAVGTAVHCTINVDGVRETHVGADPGHTGSVLMALWAPTVTMKGSTHKGREDGAMCGACDGRV